MLELRWSSLPLTKAMSQRHCNFYCLADEAIITQELSLKDGRGAVAMTEVVAAALMQTAES